MKLYTIDQRQNHRCPPKTLRRWENSGKIIPERTLGNQRATIPLTCFSLKRLKIIPALYF